MRPCAPSDRLEGVLKIHPLRSAQKYSRALVRATKLEKTDKRICNVPDQMRSDSDGGQMDRTKATDQTANSRKLREEQGQREAE